MGTAHPIALWHCLACGILLPLRLFWRWPRGRFWRVAARLSLPFGQHSLWHFRVCRLLLRALGGDESLLLIVANGSISTYFAMFCGSSEYSRVLAFPWERAISEELAWMFQSSAWLLFSRFQSWRKQIYVLESKNALWESKITVPGRQLNSAIGALKFHFRLGPPD